MQLLFLTSTPQVKDLFIEPVRIGMRTSEASYNRQAQGYYLVQQICQQI